MKKEEFAKKYLRMKVDGIAKVSEWLDYKVLPTFVGCGQETEMPVIEGLTHEDILSILTDNGFNVKGNKIRKTVTFYDNPSTW